MHKCKISVVGAFILVVAFQVGIVVVADARPLLPGPTDKGLSANGGGLVLKVSKKHCQRVFVCDYFAPATSCSVPPCCKKGHWEKNCEKKAKSKSGESTPSNPTLEKHTCYPICQAKCAKTRGSATIDQCITDCLQTTRC